MVEPRRHPGDETVERIDERGEQPRVANVLEDERFDREPCLRRHERVPVLEGEAAADAPALEQQGQLEEADCRDANAIAALLRVPEDAIGLAAQAAQVPAGARRRRAGAYR